MKKYTWVGMSIIIVGVSLILIFTVVYKPNRPPNPPAALSPEDSQNEVPFRSLVLSWKCSDPDGDELTYSVYFGESRDSMLPIATNITTESVKIEDLKPSTEYYWKVVAVDSKGTERLSKIWKFRTKGNTPPELKLKSPSPGSIVTTPEVLLTWEATDPDGDPLRFDIYLGYPEPKLLARNVKDSAYRVSGLEFGKIYSWRVVARDDHDGENSSSVWKFAVLSKPKLLSPANGSKIASRKITLKWSVEGGSAQTFDLLLGKSPDDMKVIARNLKKNSYTLTDLEPSTAYYWKVVSRLEEFKMESDVWSFKTVFKANNPPSPPTSPSPPNGAVDVDTNPVLSWDCSDVDGDKLVYTVYFGVSGSTPTVVASGLTVSRLKLKNLKTRTEYVWKVVAYDSKGASTEGELWSFTTVATPNNPPTPPVVISPKRTENLPTSVKFAWKAIDPDGDVLTYDLYFGESPNPPLLVSDLKKPEYEVKDLEYDKIYYWYVVAKDPKGATSVSEVWKFRTRIKVLQKPVIDRLLLSGGPEGIFVIDVSDPADPKIKQRVPVYTKRLASLTVGLYGKIFKVLYSASKDRLIVLKYTDDSISELTDIGGPSGMSIAVKDIESAGDRIAVSFGLSGFGVIDSRYPANPRWLWSVEDLSGVSGRLFVSGDEVFVACGTGGVSVISLGSFHSMKNMDLDTDVSDVFVRDDLLYAVDLKRGLKIYDISDPSLPRLVSSVPIDGAVALTVSSSTAYIAGEYGMAVVDVSNVSSPDVLSEVHLDGESRDILVEGPYAYVAGDEFAVVDVSDPRKPRVVGRLDFGSFASAVDFGEKAVYVADRGKGVKVFDPENLSLINELDTASFVSDISVLKGYLYLVDRIDGLIVLDAKTGTLVRRLFLPGFAKDIAIGGGLALIVSEFSKEVSVIDVKDPGDPKMLPSIEFASVPSDVAWLSGRLFALVGRDISVLNLEDPTKPRVLASVELNGVANSVAALGKYLAVSIEGYGVVLYDLSDPSKPERIWSTEIESPEFVTIARNLLIIGCENGIKLVDLEKREILSEIELPAPSDAVLIGSKLYVADSDNGLVVIDVSDPLRPKISKDLDWLNFYDVDTPPREEKE